MRKYLTAFITGLSTLISCNAGNSAILSYIHNATRVSLPDTLTIVSEFDQGELEAGGKYQLQQKDIKAFVTKNQFQPLDQVYHLTSHFNEMGEMGLYPLTDTIPLANLFHLKYFSGCKSQTFWIYTINEITGELWIEIQYPDWQGQGPQCN